MTSAIATKRRSMVVQIDKLHLKDYEDLRQYSMELRRREMENPFGEAEDVVGYDVSRLPEDGEYFMALPKEEEMKPKWDAYMEAPRATILFCGCGFEGEPIITLFKVPYPNKSPNQLVASYTQSHYSCPECQEECLNYFHATGHEPSSQYLDMAHVFDDAETTGKVVLSMGSSCYYFNNKVGKLAHVKQPRMRLTLNIETGVVYYTGKGCKNMSYGSFSKKERNRLWFFLSMPESLSAMKEWVRLCFKYRGVKFYKPELDGPDGVDKFRYAIMMMRIPMLQHFPYELSTLPRNYRLRLGKAQNVNDIWEAVTGVSFKTARKYMLQSMQHFLYFLSVSRAFKDPNNLMKYVQAANIDTTEVHEHLEAHVDTAETFANAFTYLKDHLFNGSELVTMNHIMKMRKYDTVRKGRPILFKRREGRYAWELEYDNQNQRVLEDDPIAQRNQPYDARWSESHVLDIMRMLEHIEESIQHQNALLIEQGEPLIPPYKLTYNGFLETLHHDLVRDMRRYEAANQKIQYTEREEQFSYAVGEFMFKLAPDTHTLRDVGHELNLCVGGYARTAVNKQTIIVNVYKAEEIYMCIDVRPNAGSYTLEQAKLYDNDLPGKEDAQMVVDWCKKNNIAYRDNRDISAYIH